MIQRKIAGWLFLSLCIVLAVLLLFKAIPPLVGGSLFAVALVVLGGLSRGFTHSGK